ncbi:Lysine acetyltransferase-like protein [Cladobotryum mycophilum]|uniref:Lysine acetyltransferase-like protein n=1 Tax=Cladobotryum mycophilum TaxID=491253 RepID=A0ABR0SGP5_9HYPO
MDLPPDFNPDRLVLREASYEEKIQSWRNNSASWRGQLTVNQYITQQTINGNQELTGNGRIRYWIYTDGKKIYTSAETLQKPAVVCTRGGETAKGWTYGVAAVFTVPEYRGRGCASSMMRKLAKWLDSHDVPCQFTVLWSAVGGFYGQFGWSTFATREALIPATAIPENTKTISLSSEQLRPLCEMDVDKIVQKCQNSAQTSRYEACVACIPTFAQAKWHFGSEEYIASQLFTSPGRIPNMKGAANLERTMWCYWLHDFNANKLIILRFVFDEEACGEEYCFLQSIGSILQAARREASIWNLKHVSIWDPSPRVIEAGENVLDVRLDISEEIQGNIPCLRWKNDKWGDGVVREVSWQLREMYPWC